MILRAILSLIALIALYGASAGAQGICGKRAMMVEKLVNKYHETQMGIGLGQGDSRLIEIWANCDTETWTILKTYPNGTACLMAAGDNWHGKGCSPGRPT